MKTTILSLTLFSIIALGACRNARDPGSSNPITEKKQVPDTIPAVPLQSSPIPFTVVENYFVRNTYKRGTLANPKIETPEQFEAIFGAAATMKARPTPIDFSKQYVIAVIGNETDTATEIKPAQLRQQPDGTIAFTYQLKKKGGKQTFSTIPLLLIAVDKMNTGPVITREQ